MAISPALIAGITGLAGGLIGQSAGKGGPSQQALAQLAAEVKGISVPELYEMEITVQDLLALNLVSQEEAEALSQDPSLLAAFTTDSTVKNAYMDALNTWQSLADQGGLSDTDKARLSDIEQRMAIKERGAREAILQQAHQRGIGGSGLELAQQLISQQEAAGRRSMEGLDVAARAEQRALEALARQEGLAKDIRGQDFAEASKKSEAQDIINKFNVQDARRVRDENIARKAQVDQANWENQQRISEANTMRRQKEDERRANLRQQKFTNQLAKAQARAGIQGDRGSLESAAKKAEAGIYGGTLGTVGTILNRGYKKKV